MPTRRLIGLALACGLAILVAGGIALVRLDRNTPRLETLAPDHPADVDGSVVNARTLTHNESGSIQVRFDVTAGTTVLQDPTAGWELLATSALRPTAARCEPAGPLAPHQQASCTLDFDSSSTGSNTRWVLVYATATDRAQWSFTA